MLMSGSQPGYKHLKTYQLATVNYDLTVEFCDRFVEKRSRTYDQMVQAGRSQKQNIAEGWSFRSLKGYIKLLGVAKGSAVELLEDYLDFARQRGIPIWPKTDQRVRGIREVRVVRKPDLPENPEEAVNLMITLLNQEIFLLERQIKSLEEKFVREGGYSENLFRERLKQRNPLD